jgi:amino acid permease
MDKQDKHCGIARIKESITKDEMNDILGEIQKNLQSLVKKEQGYVYKFKRHHKMLFAFLVFFAINLLWYGMWGIVSALPLLNNPVIAVIIGTIILIATGYFYENLISTASNKNKKLYQEKRQEV